MHEVSLVRSLISQAIRAAAPVGPQQIRAIHVSVGPLTGVEPVLVQQAFESLKPPAGLLDCTLNIEVQTLQATCRECQLDFEVLDFVFRCPQCSSSCVQVTQGDEFRLISLEVAQTDFASIEHRSKLRRPPSNTVGISDG